MLDLVKGKVRTIIVPGNLVFISSPYGGCNDNRTFAKAVCKKMIKDGFNPFAPHAYYTYFLNEKDPKQRALGINYGLVMMSFCSEMWMFVHAGISEGMKLEEKHAKKLGLPIKRVDWSNIIQVKT